ncbi:MAG: RNHCP domain-containing protein [Candidatus Moranbacteria bacterium]|nr:RNHCP domain-containing protein [Candidatus Moranbacteria bacterium]
MSNTFRRKKEDFTCEQCGFFVAGNGYTNHCPKCLWGKHVDIHPGDRASLCGGMLRPFSWTKERQVFSVIHTCVKCGFVGRNKLSEEDSMDALIALKQKPI